MSPPKMVEMFRLGDGQFCDASACARVAPVNDEGIAARIAHLKLEHRDLDAAIDALRTGGGDQLQVARLKKRKLLLKDEIAQLQDQLVPDIIA